MCDTSSFFYLHCVCVLFLHFARVSVISIKLVFIESNGMCIYCDAGARTRTPNVLIIFFYVFAADADSPWICGIMHSRRSVHCTYCTLTKSSHVCVRVLCARIEINILIYYMKFLHTVFIGLFHVFIGKYYYPTQGK